jgi:hypothetical protein
VGLLVQCLQDSGVAVALISQEVVRTWLVKNVSQTEACTCLVYGRVRRQHVDIFLAFRVPYSDCKETLAAASARWINNLTWRPMLSQRHCIHSGSALLVYVDAYRGTHTGSG